MQRIDIRDVHNVFTAAREHISGLPVAQAYERLRKDFIQQQIDNGEILSVFRWTPRFNEDLVKAWEGAGSDVTKRAILGAIQDELDNMVFAYDVRTAALKELEPFMSVTRKAVDWKEEKLPSEQARCKMLSAAVNMLGDQLTNYHNMLPVIVSQIEARHIERQKQQGSSEALSLREMLDFNFGRPSSEVASQMSRYRGRPEKSTRKIVPDGARLEC